MSPPDLLLLVFVFFSPRHFHSGCCHVSCAIAAGCQIYVSASSMTPTEPLGELEEAEDPLDGDGTDDPLAGDMELPAKEE